MGIWTAIKNIWARDINLLRNVLLWNTWLWRCNRTKRGLGQYCSVLSFNSQKRINLEKKKWISKEKERKSGKWCDTEVNRREYFRNEGEVNSVNAAKNSSKRNTEKCPLELVKWESFVIFQVSKTHCSSLLRTSAIPSTCP